MTQASDGTGNAVADLKAGYGAAAIGEGYVAPGAGTAVPDEERVVPVPGNSRWEDEAAYWRARCLRAEGAVPDAVPVEPEVEQGDGFYWMKRARRAEGALRQVSNLIAAISKRVVKAEDILRGWRERTYGQ